ncbi:MAG: hypothetical protein L7S47_08310 [Acidimicrobiales bacterium]|nr:hypothetical protein [Acidimicrobiales bacterium]
MTLLGNSLVRHLVVTLHFVGWGFCIRSGRRFRTHELRLLAMNLEEDRCLVDAVMHSETECRGRQNNGMRRRKAAINKLPAFDFAW